MGLLALWGLVQHPVLFIVCLLFVIEVKSQCSKQDYQYCVKLADPLLKDPHLIYPDNPKDIEHVCRTWSFFVDCVKTYTDRCFTENRRQEFNRAVESPVNSIHRLCSTPDYRQEYMKHANCMKKTLTEDNHCGRHYRLLVSQVSGEAPRSSICCSHHLFRECVLDQTRNSCENDAETFSGQMLDKALSFLREQCNNFVPNSIDCPGTEFYRTTSAGRDTVNKIRDRVPDLTSSSSTTAVEPSSMPTSNSKTISSSSPLPSQIGESSNSRTVPEWTSSWMPGRGRSSDSIPTEITNHNTVSNPWNPRTTSPENKYNRWTPTTTTDVRWTPSSSSSSGSVTPSSTSRSSFGRGMTWEPTVATLPTRKTWFPGASIDNSIDEPNQQGLGSQDNGAIYNKNLSLLAFTFISFLLVFR